MEIGDTIDFRGPSGKLEYLGYGVFSIKVNRKEPAVKLHVKKIAMIAGKFQKADFCFSYVIFIELKSNRWYRHYTNVAINTSNNQGFKR